MLANMWNKTKIFENLINIFTYSSKYKCSDFPAGNVSLDQITYIYEVYKHLQKLNNHLVIK